MAKISGARVNDDSFEFELIVVLLVVMQCHLLKFLHLFFIVL
jgi:hypothetical protein